ncbi:MAG: hypothetical protein JWP36_54 [Paucimonas sp.]|nr:hypothetical protein [Paucimonas sp.]
MEFVDNGEKIRRNLLAFSALIIVSAFLGDSVTKDFAAFGLHFSDVPKLKLWGLATSILLYLALRFRFSAQTKVAKGEAQVEGWDTRRAVMRLQIQHALIDLIQAGKHSPLFPDGLGIQQDYESSLRRLGTDAGSARKVIIRVEELSHGADEGHFQAIVESTSITKFNSEHAYQYRHASKLRLMAFLFFRSFYSAGFVEFRIPYLAFVAALGICTYQLMTVINA